jgi:hypothetical protein
LIQKKLLPGRKRGSIRPRRWALFVTTGDIQSGLLADQARQERAKLDFIARTQTGFDKAKALGTVQGWDEFLSKVATGDFQSQAA